MIFEFTYRKNAINHKNTLQTSNYRQITDKLIFLSLNKMRESMDIFKQSQRSTAKITDLKTKDLDFT